MNDLEMLFTPSPIWRPWLHDRVTISEVRAEGLVPVVCLVGMVHCEHRSGPNIFDLAAAAMDLLGRGGLFGYHGSRFRGFREPDEPAPEDPVKHRPCAYGCGMLAASGDIFCAPCRSGHDRGGC